MVFLEEDVKVDAALRDPKISAACCIDLPFELVEIENCGQNE